MAENPSKDRGKEALKNIHITSSYTEHITTKKATEPQIVEIIEDDNDLNSTTDKIKTYENPTFNKAAAAGIAEIQEDRKDETIADKKPILLVEKEASSFNTEDLDESKIKWCTPFIEDSSEICIQDSLEEVKYLAMELINVSYCWLMSHYVKFLYLGHNHRWPTITPLLVSNTFLFHFWQDGYDPISVSIGLLSVFMCV